MNRCVTISCSIRGSRILFPVCTSAFHPSQIKQLLRDGGGTREFYVAPLVTHVITDDPLGDGILAPVKDAPVPVVHVRMGCVVGGCEVVY